MRKFNFLKDNIANWRWWAALPVVVFVAIPLVSFVCLLVLFKVIGDYCHKLAEWIDTGPLAKPVWVLVKWIRREK